MNQILGQIWLREHQKECHTHICMMEDQSVATIYGAERTPEFYLLDSTGIVVYRGRLDDSLTRDPRSRDNL